MPFTRDGLGMAGKRSTKNKNCVYEKITIFG